MPHPIFCCYPFIYSPLQLLNCLYLDFSVKSHYLPKPNSTGAGPLKKNPPRKITPHQVFGDLGSKWPPDEDPGRCRAGTPWHFALFAKIQYGRRSPGMVTPTFFLWEINQKFFFLP